MIRLLLVAAVVCGCDWLETEGDLNTPVCGDGIAEEYETCDDGNRVSGDQCSRFCEREDPLTVDWRVISLATGESTACPAGFDRAVVRTAPHYYHGCSFPPCDDNPVTDARGEQSFVLECASSRQQLFVEPQLGSQTVHYITVAIENSTTGERYAESVRHRVMLADTNTNSSHTLYSDAGFIGLTWEVRNATQRTTCEAVGIEGVRIVATPTAGGSATMVDVPCATAEDLSHTAFTPALAPGAYSVELTAGGATTQLDNITVGTRNEITALGLVALQF